MMSGHSGVSEKHLISLQGISKTYASGTKALAPTELDVEAGEFLTLLGPSGCGKSTILRLIAGLEQPTSGTLTRGFSEGETSIAYVFQEPTLMPWASVFDNVYLPLKLQHHSRKQAEERVMECLKLVNLTAFARAFPRELSGGMKMRASIARALILNPVLLLMDEPFAALDEFTRFKLNDDLLRLKQRLSMTVIFVTHSVYESVYLSTRIAAMSANPGRIKAEIALDSNLIRDEDFRSSPAFMTYAKQASHFLRDDAAC